MNLIRAPRPTKKVPPPTLACRLGAPGSEYFGVWSNSAFQPRLAGWLRPPIPLFNLGLPVEVGWGSTKPP